MKKVVLSVFPNKFVWLVGVDVEFVLPCRSDPLGRHGDGEHAWAVAVKTLVGALAVVLLRLKELVVEVHVVLASLRELTCGQQQLDEQLVQFLFRYRLRSSMQSPPQQKTEKTARIISRFDSLSTYCEVPGGSRLQRKEYGQICPKRKIFRQKR